MLTFEAFAGINNVAPEYRMKGSDLVVATDVDIGLTGEVTRRTGFTEVSAMCHKNLWQASGFMLATTGSELVAIRPDGTRTTLHPAVGHERLWYCNLPDGRVTFANGMIHGITDGVTSVERGVKAPESLGAPDTAFGGLFPGQYRYHLTYIRLADRIEGPASSSAPITISHGGLRIDALPELEGHSICVYLSGQDGEGAYLAGETTAGSFEFGGKNSDLVLPCRTVGARPFPVGTITAFWRGRVLAAQDNTLWASRPSSPHLSDWRDFKPFMASITAIQPVDDGIYVGTTDELIFLSGTSWDQLTYTSTQLGPVTPGSGVSAPGHRLKLGDGAGAGTAMLCIAGGYIVAGFNGGQTSRLTAERYHTAAAEVCATFRDTGSIPQYLAVPQ